MVLIASLTSFGCESRVSPSSASSTRASSAANASHTIDRVRKIVSEQMRVALEKVTPKTSLGDLAADELDFVELIMELEESFSITISDTNAEALTGTSDWQKGMNNVTIERLSSLVNDCGK
jgi:acyl carrier protein